MDRFAFLHLPVAMYRAFPCAYHPERIEDEAYIAIVSPLLAEPGIHDLVLKAKGFRDAIYGAGDKLKTSGDELLSDLQANYVDDMRRSVSHMTGWQRYRVKRMIEMYPQLLDYFARTREEIMEVADISSLLGELRFLRMDLEAFFTHEKNEMY